MDALEIVQLVADQVERRVAVDRGVGQLGSEAPRDDRRPRMRGIRRAGANRVRIAEGEIPQRSTSANALQTSTLVRTRRTTSAVKSLVEA